MTRTDVVEGEIVKARQASANGGKGVSHLASGGVVNAGKGKRKERNRLDKKKYLYVTKGHSKRT